jgi:HEAT repeats
MAEHKESLIRNRNFRHPVTVIEERPDLDAVGPAGARLRLELLLSAPEGVTSRALARLDEDEKTALRRIASEVDPARGIQLQNAALGALGQVRDEGATLLTARLAQAPATDERVKVEAVAALGEIGGAGAIDVVRGLVESGEREVRAQAVRVIAKLGTAEDVGRLERIAESDRSFVGAVARSASSALRQRLQLGER